MFRVRNLSPVLPLFSPLKIYFIFSTNLKIFEWWPVDDHTNGLLLTNNMTLIQIGGKHRFSPHPLLNVKLIFILNPALFQRPFYLALRRFHDSSF